MKTTLINTIPIGESIGRVWVGFMKPSLRPYARLAAFNFATLSRAVVLLNVPGKGKKL
jgi:hypothetical protein